LRYSSCFARQTSLGFFFEFPAYLYIGERLQLTAGVTRSSPPFSRLGPPLRHGLPQRGNMLWRELNPPGGILSSLDPIEFARFTPLGNRGLGDIEQHRRGWRTIAAIGPLSLWACGWMLGAARRDGIGVANPLHFAIGEEGARATLRR